MEIANTQAIDPRIGVLCRDGQPIYYAYAPDYIESDEVHRIYVAIYEHTTGQPFRSMWIG